jgi:hypothetical protein
VAAQSGESRGKIVVNGNANKGTIRDATAKRAMIAHMAQIFP